MNRTPQPHSVEDVTGVANLMSGGSIELRVYGSGIGLDDYSSQVHVGLTACESTKWTSDTLLVCLTGGGSAGTLRVTGHAPTRNRPFIPKPSAACHGSEAGSFSRLIDFCPEP